MTVAVLAPGQGGQRAGVLTSLLRDPDAAAALLPALRSIDATPEELDAPSSLATSEGAQLATVACSLAAAAQLARHGVAPTALAGHSVGAFSAAVLAGALDARDALAVVRLRGRAMDAVAGTWAMVAVEGVDARTALRVAAEASTDAEPVWLACDNAPDQVVLGTAWGAMDRVEARIRAHGARRAVRLQVPAPSHSPLLADVVEVVARALDDVEVRAPAIELTCASTGRLARTAAQVRADLAGGAGMPVRWRTTVASLVERGARGLVALPPGAVPVAVPDGSQAQVLRLGELGAAVVARRVRRA